MLSTTSADPAAPKAAAVNSTRGRRGAGGGAVTNGLTAVVAIRRLASWSWWRAS